MAMKAQEHNQSVAEYRVWVYDSVIKKVGRTKERLDQEDGIYTKLFDLDYDSRKQCCHYKRRLIEW